MTTRPERLTPRQAAVLRAVCETNGGGLHVSIGRDGNEAQILSLYARGLVQGKAGNPHLVVHTADGLALHRKLAAGS